MTHIWYLPAMPHYQYHILLLCISTNIVDDCFDHVATRLSEKM